MSEKHCRAVKETRLSDSEGRLSKAIADHCKCAKLLKGHESRPLTSSPYGINIIPERDVCQLRPNQKNIKNRFVQICTKRKIMFVLECKSAKKDVTKGSNIYI